jgi:hypothetical protein
MAAGAIVMHKIFLSALLGVSLNASLAHAASDPFFAQQWSLQNDGSLGIPIDIDELHTQIQLGVPGVDVGYLQAQSLILAQAKNPVLVAVIDYGIDPSHPDLQGRISSEGFDFLTNTNVLSDDEGHGTHVSGIIAANSENGFGITGLTPAVVQILPLRVLSKDFQNFSFKNRLISDYAADAILYAISKKVAVINMSLGWPKLVDSDKVRQAVQQALDAGIVIVAAAGNDLKEQPTYPCAYKGVICVGAVTNTGALSLYSNWGGKVDLLAPGDYVISTFPTSLESQYLRVPGYEALSGTSQAAPFISAMAALLRSQNPTVSRHEIMGRILAATEPAPTYLGAPAAQYGVPKLSRIFNKSSKATYWVDFKSLEDLLVSESDLSLHGSLEVTNLWGQASGVKIQILIQGQESGSISLPQLPAEDTINIPWSYKFSSLSASADLEFKVQIQDSQGNRKEFVSHLTASRPAATLSQSQILRAPVGVLATDWLATNILGRLTGRFSSVSKYGQSFGAPEYFRIQAKTNTGLQIQILSLDQAAKVQSLFVPGALQITQVIHFPTSWSGNSSWVVTALGLDSNGSYFFQFYHLDKNLQPVAENPVQRMPATLTALDNLIPRNYASPGSWIVDQKGRWVPCFLDVGPLPKIDNFDEFDPRSNQVSQHFYYLEADPTVSPAAGIQNLRIRALDSKTWALAYPQASLIQPLPQSSQDLLLGHRKFLFGSATNLLTPVQILHVDGLGQLSFENSQWQRLDSYGDRVLVTGRDQEHAQMAFVAYTDPQHGSLAWTDSSGAQLGTTSFSYQQTGDPFVGKVISINEISGVGSYWFLQSHDNLVGYFQDVAGVVHQDHKPLERDSSFSTESFNLMFAGAVVGTTAHPQPGVFIDSTQVEGNRVNVLTLETGRWEKDLRYSLNIPSHCLNIEPVALTKRPEDFAVPLVCVDKDKSIYFILTKP